jgi:hypothetical protein
MINNHITIFKPLYPTHIHSTNINLKYSTIKISIKSISIDDYLLITKLI